jgi:hypothetical protein
MKLTNFYYPQIIALFAIIAVANCGVIPTAAYISPYASTFNAHTINHAIASPLIAPSAKIIASPYAYSPYTYPFASYSYPTYI